MNMYPRLLAGKEEETKTALSKNRWSHAVSLATPNDQAQPRRAGGACEGSGAEGDTVGWSAGLGSRVMEICGDNTRDAPNQSEQMELMMQHSGNDEEERADKCGED